MGTSKIERWGKVINDMLELMNVQVMIEMPEGTLEAKVTDNLDMGGVVQFYVILNAIKPAYEKMRSEVTLELNDEGWEKVVDGLLTMVKKEMMEVGK